MNLIAGNSHHLQSEGMQKCESRDDKNEDIEVEIFDLEHKHKGND